MENDLLFSCVNVEGKTFLDIGCNDGDTARMARDSGAEVTAVDYIINDHLSKNHEDIEIWPIDLFSEKWLYMPQFDVVSCQGVFYHVPDICSLFVRLRLVTREHLFLEGHYSKSDDCIMEYCPKDSLNNNHSNWWLPSESCLHELLKEAGFLPTTLQKRGNRISILAIPHKTDLRKIMPRNMDYMRLDGGTGSKLRP